MSKTEKGQNDKQTDRKRDRERKTDRKRQKKGIERMQIVMIIT